jgi:predicted membrane channel-forming protein YqfA (hemolysin III family)
VEILSQLQSTIQQLFGVDLFTLLGALIISLTFAEIFRKFFKNRLLAFLVFGTSALWIFQELAKGKTLTDVLVSMFSFVGLLIAAVVVAIKVFVEKLGVKH